MTDQMLHTPDGVRDIYNGECKQKLLLQERLHDVLRQYGYRDIDAIHRVISPATVVSVAGEITRCIASIWIS